MCAKLANARSQAGACNPLVLRIPQFPMFPLRTTHEAQHDWHAFAISAVDHGIVCNLQLPAKQVQTEILSIMHDGGVSLGLVPEEEIGRVDATSDQIVPAVYLQVEVAPGSDLRNAVICVACLRNFANTEIYRLRVG